VRARTRVAEETVADEVVVLTQAHDEHTSRRGIAIVPRRT